MPLKWCVFSFYIKRLATSRLREQRDKFAWVGFEVTLVEDIRDHENYLRPTKPIPRNIAGVECFKSLV